VVQPGHQLRQYEDGQLAIIFSEILERDGRVMSRPQYLVLVALTALVVLTVLAVLGAGLGLFPEAKESLTKWGPVGALAEIIALFSFVTKALFSRVGLALLLGPPRELPDFDITRIEWAEEDCVVRAGEKRERVKLVPARAGGSFRVQLPHGFLDTVDGQQAIELSLKDAKGNRWSVRPFFPLENMVPLFLVESEEKIIADYGEADR
jgi:hypothetical protein